MITADDNDLGHATNPDGEGSFSIPSSVLLLLTTRCLATAAVLQVLGVSAPVFSPLLPLGLVLAAIGLGAYACVSSGRIENGWAFLGLVPVLGLLIGYAVLRFRQPIPNAPLNALRGAVHAALLGLIVLASLASMINFMQRGSEVRGEVPDYFPILAVVPEIDSSFTAHIVPKRNFDNFAREHPDFSYLVPKDLEASLNENLQHSPVDLFRPAYFEVSEISAGRQGFEVRYPIHPEAYSVGWYEATAQGIEPNRYLFFHEMMLGFFAIPMLLIAGTVYSLLSWLLDRKLWPRFAKSHNKVVATG
jgi:hypothetical protein